MKTEGVLEKKNKDNKSNNDSLSKTIILGLIGLILLFIPGTLNKIIGIVIGAALLLTGLLTIYKYMKNKEDNNSITSLIIGILYSVLGAVIIIYPYSVINFLAVCLGVYLVITSIAKFQIASVLKKTTNNWLGTLIVAIIILILGLILIFNPFSGITVTKLAGAFLVAVAVFDIIDVYILQKK